MRAVIQRVSEAQVEVEGEVRGAIERGLLMYLGVGKGDTEEDAGWVAEKAAGLRVFEDDGGRMNRSVVEVCGSVLVISQFTLYGDCRKGRRPSFDPAADPETAEALYELTKDRLRAQGLRVESGVFAAHMHVSSTNDGPVTLLVDSRKHF